MTLWSPSRQRSSLLGLRVFEALNPVDSPNVLVMLLKILDTGGQAKSGLDLRPKLPQGKVVNQWISAVIPRGAPSTGAILGSL